MGLLSANALMGPLSLLGAGMVCPIPSGRCAEPFWVRDFSGLGSWSPAIIFIAGDQVSFLSFPRGRDTRRPARMRAKVRKFWKLLEDQRPCR